MKRFEAITERFFTERMGASEWERNPLDFSFPWPLWAFLRDRFRVTPKLQERPDFWPVEFVVRVFKWAEAMGKRGWFEPGSYFMRRTLQVPDCCQGEALP